MKLYPHDTLITGQATECREQCAQELYREIKDPAKMTNAKIDLVERGLGAKRAHAKSQSVMMMMGWLCVRAGALGVCVHTCGAAHPLAPRRGTELVVARPARAGVEHSLARELNPATPSTRLRAGPGVRGEQRKCTMEQRLAQVFLYGKVKTPAK